MIVHPTSRPLEAFLLPPVEPNHCFAGLVRISSKRLAVGAGTSGMNLARLCPPAEKG